MQMFHHSRYSAGRADASTQTVLHAARALVVAYITPAPAVNCSPAPVSEKVVPAPAITDIASFLEPLMPVVQVVQVPQVQIMEQIVEIPEIPSAQSAQTSVSLGTAPVSSMKPAKKSWSSVHCFLPNLPLRCV